MALTSRLLKKDLVSLFYHNLFDYPLKKEDLIRWQAGIKTIASIKIPKKFKINYQEGFYFLGKNQNLIKKRRKRVVESAKKIPFLTQACFVLNKIPTIKMVAVTGSLAMENAHLNSDIDLMIITQQNTLWLTRVVAFFLLIFNGIKLRHANNKKEKNRLCLNIWIDEKDLLIKNQNVYTSHEISQIIPVLNKDKTYERFLKTNQWILDWWPKGAVISKSKRGVSKTKNKKDFNNFILMILNYLTFILQYFYMKPKITQETITLTRAFFHPFDWSNYIKKQGF